MGMLIQDLSFAFRSLLRQKGFAATALLSLALGIGVNSAIFSVASALLMRPLPYKDAARLVILWNRSPGLNITQDWFSTAQYFDIRNSHHGFEQVAIAIGANYNLSGEGNPERVGTVRVSSNLLPMLGARAEIGRLFAAADDVPGGTPAALLSWGIWTRRFGGSGRVLGQSIRLNGVTYQVVGILPRTFSLPLEVMPTLGRAEQADILLPLPLSAAAVNDRGHEDYNIVGKLRRGVSVEQARAEMDTITARLRREHPDLYPLNSGLTFDVVPLLEQVVGDVRHAIALFAAAVGLVLLIACANVANLQLSRSLARRREIGVRMAVGAGRARIVRMALTESVLLSTAGGVLGIFFAMACIEWMRKLGRGSIPRLEQIGLSAEVVLYTFLLCLLAGVLSGLIPALRLGRLDVNESLRSGGRGSGHTLWGGNHARKLLVAGELALCTLVLTGAGLLARSYAGLMQVQPGFAPGNIQTFGLTLTGPKYAKATSVIETYRQLYERLEHIPGQGLAGAVSTLPLSEMFAWGPVTIEGRTPPAGESFFNADLRIAGGHYFQAMGIPLKRGRLFDEHDIVGAPRVALIDEYMAEQFWPGEDPVGKRFHTGREQDDRPWITIVGVVGRVKQYSLDADSRIAIYLPQTQSPAREMSVVSTGSRLLTAPAIQQAVRGVDSDLPVYLVKPMSARVSDSLSRQRFTLFLFQLFALLALALAVAGVYGLMAVVVSQGTRDIGIRIALGASGRTVRGMILREAMAVAAPGVICGVAGALAGARLLRTMLFHVAPSDPLTLTASALVLIAVCLTASFVPAHRAARVDPIISLRDGE